MKYGLTRYVYVYDFKTEKGEKVIATGGDYIRSQMWCKNHVKVSDEGLNDLLQTYAWAYFALKRLGKLGDYGIDADPSQDALIGMADKVSVYTESIKDDELPLATQAPES